MNQLITQSTQLYCLKPIQNLYVIFLPHANVDMADTGIDERGRGRERGFVLEGLKMTCLMAERGREKIDIRGNGVEYPQE